MYRLAARSALFVVVLLTLFVVGAGAYASAQTPSQAPAATTTSAPTPPPAPPDVAAVPADAEKSRSGLAWKVLKPGTGSVHPTPTDFVDVNYNGWTNTGRIFDSTDMRGRPSHYRVGGILPGMSEAIQLLTVGEKRRFWVPEKLAFNGVPGKPQGTVVFEIELLKIEAGQPAGLSQAAPPDVAAAPADAEKTKSGLASKVIKPGTGKVHPKASSTVVVKYVGWTTKGEMFDASALHPDPADVKLGGEFHFPLNGVIAGWTEGIQLMVEGEHRRFWIPGKLAYDNDPRPDVPKGPLVFDVVLVKIQ